MTDIDAIIREGYFPVRVLRSGEVIGIKNMLFTVSLVTGLTKDGYRSRYCYENRADAEIALSSWDGRGDPPGLWIKEKGIGVDRLGPGAVKEQSRPTFKDALEDALKMYPDRAEHHEAAAEHKRNRGK